MRYAASTLRTYENGLISRLRSFYRIPGVDDPQPLWASSKTITPEEIPTCELCRAERKVEFQVRQLLARCSELAVNTPSCRSSRRFFPRSRTTPSTLTRSLSTPARQTAPFRHETAARRAGQASWLSSRTSRPKACASACSGSVRTRSIEIQHCFRCGSVRSEA